MYIPFDVVPVYIDVFLKVILFECITFFLLLDYNMVMLQNNPSVNGTSSNLKLM